MYETKWDVLPTSKYDCHETYVLVDSASDVMDYLTDVGVEDSSQIIYFYYRPDVLKIDDRYTRVLESPARLSNFASSACICYATLPHWNKRNTTVSIGGYYGRMWTHVREALLKNLVCAYNWGDKSRFERSGCRDVQHYEFEVR